jgi:hypothetical protein
MSKKIELLTKHHCLKSCHASAIVYNLGVKLKKKKKELEMTKLKKKTFGLGSSVPAY